MKKKLIGLVFAGALAGGALLPAVALAHPPDAEHPEGKVILCHFEDGEDGGEGYVTIEVSPGAAAQHLANGDHDDSLGACD